MNDEIKEILDKLEIVARKHTIEVCDDGSKIETMPASIVDELRLNNWSAKLLLDYITNLQEQLHQASLDIQELIERDIECPSWCDKLTNLQQENEKLKEQVNDNKYAIKPSFTTRKLQDYKSRIEKAVEYIKKDTRWFDSEYAKVYGELCTCAGANANRLEVLVNPSNLLNILNSKE